MQTNALHPSGSLGALFAVASLLVLSAVPTTARAQSRAVELDVSSLLELNEPEAALLSSIEAESTVATALYVSGTILTVGGVVALLPAWFASIFNDAAPWLGLAGAIGGTGLALLGVAVGLDVDAGSRRSGLERKVRVRIGLAGASLGVSF